VTLIVASATFLLNYRLLDGNGLCGEGFSKFCNFVTSPKPKEIFENHKNHEICFFGVCFVPSKRILVVIKDLVTFLGKIKSVKIA